MMIHFAVATSATATDRPLDNTAADVLGEFLRGMNALSGGKKALPAGDPFLENVRSRYEVPERIQVLAPRGGSEIIVMVFNSERLPVVQGKWSEISTDDYKYLQSYHNLKAVYCLYEKEPLDLGDVVVAFKYNDAGTVVVFFNDKRGTVGSTRIHSGNSIIFSGSQYIVRPMLQAR